MSDEVISINVGGTVFSTTKTTVLQAKDGILARMIRAEVTVTRDIEGNIFIDRDPKKFESILEYLRTGNWNGHDPKCTLDQLQAEAKYFGLTTLLKSIHKKKSIKCVEQQKGERPSRIISFNVGGTVFATSRQTVMKYPNSMLARICSTDVPVEKDSNGVYFIDRDPEIFRLILNYLRNGYLSKMPQDCTTRPIQSFA